MGGGGGYKRPCETLWGLIQPIGCRQREHVAVKENEKARRGIHTNENSCPNGGELNFAGFDLHNNDEMQKSCKSFSLTDESIMADNNIMIVADLRAGNRACATHDSGPCRGPLILHNYKKYAC